MDAPEGLVLDGQQAWEELFHGEESTKVDELKKQLLPGIHMTLLERRTLDPRPVTFVMAEVTEWLGKRGYTKRDLEHEVVGEDGDGVALKVVQLVNAASALPAGIEAMVGPFPKPTDLASAIGRGKTAEGGSPRRNITAAAVIAMYEGSSPEERARCAQLAAMDHGTFKRNCLKVEAGVSSADLPTMALIILSSDNQFAETTGWLCGLAQKRPAFKEAIAELLVGVRGRGFLAHKSVEVEAEAGRIAALQLNELEPGSVAQAINVVDLFRFPRLSPFYTEPVQVDGTKRWSFVGVTGDDVTATKSIYTDALALVDPRGGAGQLIETIEGLNRSELGEANPVTLRMEVSVLGEFTRLVATNRSTADVLGHHPTLKHFDGIDSEGKLIKTKNSAWTEATSKTLVDATKWSTDQTDQRRCGRCESCWNVCQNVCCARFLSCRRR